MKCPGIARKALSHRLGNATLAIRSIPGSKQVVDHVENTPIVPKNVRDYPKVKLQSLNGKHVVLGGIVQESFGLKFWREPCIKVVGESTTHPPKCIAHFFGTGCFLRAHVVCR